MIISEFSKKAVPDISFLPNLIETLHICLSRRSKQERNCAGSRSLSRSRIFLSSGSIDGCAGKEVICAEGVLEVGEVFGDVIPKGNAKASKCLLCGRSARAAISNS